MHGGAGFFDHSVYVEFWSRLADVAQVIFLDQRGSGRSVCDDESTWNLQRWGQDIHNFCQALNIEKPIIAGISYGGMVTMSYSIQYPEEPAGLILTDTDAHIDQAHVLELVREKMQEHNKPADEYVAITKQILTGPLEEAVVEKYFNEVLNCFGNPPEVLDKFSNIDSRYVNAKLGEDFMTRELLAMDFRDKLKNTQCPVLFLSGDQGPVHSLKTAKELIAAFPESKIQYEIFKDAKPACYEFYPERAMELMKTFIANLDASFSLPHGCTNREK